MIWAVCFVELDILITRAKNQVDQISISARSNQLTNEKNFNDPYFSTKKKIVTKVQSNWFFDMGNVYCWDIQVNDSDRQNFHETQVVCVSRIALEH